MDQHRRVPVSCNRDCITGCPLVAEIRNGRVERIVNSPHRSRFMTGCPRGFLFHKVLYHPDRLKRPLIRTGNRGNGHFREADWEEALDLTAGKLREISARFGPSSVMLLGGSGACKGAFHNTALIPQRFFSFFGGYTCTAGTYSSEATDFIKPHMYGTKYVGIDVKTLLSSKMVILWGFNAVDTRFGAETEGILSEVKRRGIPIIVIDPRRTRTVRKYATTWLPILPGGDTALMLAVLNHILRRGLENRKFIDTYSRGFDELERYVLGNDGSEAKTPSWAASRCGLSAQQIESFAMQYAASRPAALLPGLSIQRTLGGEEADRLGGILQLTLGNIGRPGGSTGSGQWNTLPTPAFSALPVPENPAGASVPVYQWADAVLEGREKGWPADIHCLYSVGGNYLVQGSDIGKNIEAFRKADFAVTHDYFLTDTARHSDIVFPVTTFLERRDLMRTSLNYLFWSEKAAEPVSDARNDWDIFTELAGRLGFRDEFTGGKTENQWMDELLQGSAVSDREDFFKTGIYKGADQGRIGLSDFIGNPLSNPLDTPSGLIEISLPQLENLGGCRIPMWREPENEESYPLHLVTPHDRMRNSSQFDNIPEFRRGIDDSLWINPKDAKARGIGDGEKVRVRSPQGEIPVQARVTEDIMQGVVSFSQGGWLNSPRDKPKNGGIPDMYGSSAINMVTSTVPTLPSRGARTHSVKVEVCAENP